MQTPNEHISLLTDLLPWYRSVNTLYREIVEKSVLSFDIQCNITDFYNEFNNIQSFEKVVLNFILSADCHYWRHSGFGTRHQQFWFIYNTLWYRYSFIPQFYINFVYLSAFIEICFSSFGGKAEELNFRAESLFLWRIEEHWSSSLLFYNWIVMCGLLF